MKKLYILLFISIFSLNSFAQKSFFGVNAGINVANQRELFHYSYTQSYYSFTSPYTYSYSTTPTTITSALTEVVYFKNTIKPTFGIFYHYGFNEKMGLRLNVQYMGLGYNNVNTNVSFNPSSYNVTPLISTQNITINYLTLPLTFHYHVNKHLSFNAGPYLSFVLGGTKINGESITTFYHKNDYGFSFGGEHDIYKNLAISVNYFIGLKNIWLYDTQLYDHYKYTNRALQITLLYKLRFKKS